jgi:hypothetical protein
LTGGLDSVTSPAARAHGNSGVRFWGEFNPRPTRVLYVARHQQIISHSGFQQSRLIIYPFNSNVMAR